MTPSLSDGKMVESQAVTVRRNAHDSSLTGCIVREPEQEETSVNHPELDMDGVRERLEALRAELLADSESSREARDTVMLDQTSVGRLSRMDALQGQAMAKAEEERRQLALKRITSTLTRIERGEYGECIECGEWISAKRLAWDLLVLKCIDCAQ
jgi:DnaK suppressor protein